MKKLDQKLLERMIRLAGDRLQGRWVLLGGTLLPLLGVDYRVTTDIDLVGLGKDEMGQALELIKREGPLPARDRKRIMARLREEGKKAVGNPARLGRLDAFQRGLE